MLDNKGFTVVELIMSFAFVSILTASLFAVILNYKEKEQDVSIETDLFSFKSKLTVEIQNDIQKNILDTMEYCTEGGKIKNRCVVLNFKNGTSKTLEVKTETKVDQIADSTFKYEVPYITYGGIKYTPPDAANVTVTSDYMFRYTTVTDDLENNMGLYRVKISLAHKDIDGDMDISIVALGNSNLKTGVVAPYASYNPGDMVTIQMNGEYQLNFYVIKKSSAYNDSLTLLLDSPSSIPNGLITSRDLVYSMSNSNYAGSLVQSEIDKLRKNWINPDEVRLITAEEIGYLVYACPKYREIDAPDITLNIPNVSWIYNSSYWTMSPKLSSGVNNGKVVWVVNGPGMKLTSANIDRTYSLRPVITVHKRYVTGTVRA